MLWLLEPLCVGIVSRRALVEAARRQNLHQRTDWTVPEYLATAQRRSGGDVRCAEAVLHTPPQSEIQAHCNDERDDACPEQRQLPRLHAPSAEFVEKLRHCLSASRAIELESARDRFEPATRDCHVTHGPHPSIPCLEGRPLLEGM